MKKLLWTAFAILIILVGFLGFNQVTFIYTKQMDTVPEYIEKCIESRQHFLASILCNYEASKLMNCENELAEMVSQFMQLKIKSSKNKGEKL